MTGPEWWCGAYAPNHTGSASLFHQPFDPVTTDRDAFPVELGPDLATTINLVVVLPNTFHLGQELFVIDLSYRWPAAPRCVVGGWGDRQLCTDRLDPELGPVFVDVAHERFCGRSSSAAKKAEADRKIAFDRSNSFTFASSSAIRR